MTKSCCVWGCTERLKPGQTQGFFLLPSDKRGPGRRAQRGAWLRAIRRTVATPNNTKKTKKPFKQGAVACSTSSWQPGKWTYVCWRHFVSGKPNSDPKHIDWKPTQHMEPARKIVSPRKNLAKVERYHRTMKRRSKVNEAQEEFWLNNQDACEGQEHNSTRSIGTATESTYDDYVKMLENEVHALRAEKDALQKSVKDSKFTFEHLSKKDLKFYTSIENKELFAWIVSLVTVTERTVISVCDQILLTLMKVRHAMKNKDLAHRFAISATTVSDILNECIPVLATRLEFLIKWPTDDELTRNLPAKFKKKFSRCRVIIDCTEVFLDRPYNLSARAQTWSNYKHHHTLKALVGISPWGSVCFVSKLWGGRISDKEITEKSGFYNKVQPGDQVMCDRGFTISQELARLGASLVMPPFLLGKKQLSGKRVQHARQISALRIHVERAMERIKNFEILKHVLPVTLLPLSSQILTVCGALSNLQPKLID